MLKYSVSLLRIRTMLPTSCRWMSLFSLCCNCKEFSFCSLLAWRCPNWKIARSSTPWPTDTPSNLNVLKMSRNRMQSTLLCRHLTSVDNLLSVNLASCLDSSSLTSKSLLVWASLASKPRRSWSRSTLASDNLASNSCLSFFLCASASTSLSSNSRLSSFLFPSTSASWVSTSCRSYCWDCCWSCWIMSKMFPVGTAILQECAKLVRTLKLSECCIPLLQNK